VQGAVRGRGARAALLLAASLALVGLAALVRYGVGVAYSNKALIIEGLHVGVDVVITAVIIVSMVLARSRRAQRLPYGLFKLEDLAAFMVAVVILYLALEVGIEGIEGPVPSASLIPAAAEAATIPAILGAAWLKEKAGELLRSPGLHADAVHTIVDAVEGGLVAVGLTAFWLTGVAAAYRVALIVAVIGLLLAAWEAGRDSLLSLLDIPRDRSLIDRVRRIATSHGVEVAEARARWSGPVVFVELTIRTHPLISVEDAAIIARRIADRIKKSIEGVWEVIVRIEPCRRKRFRVAIPIDKPSTEAKPSRHFGRAAYMAIIDVEADGKIRASKIIRNPYQADKEPLLSGVKTAEKLHDMGVSDVAVINIGEVSYGLLLRHQILVWRAKHDKTAKENAALLAKGQLEKLREPTHEKPWASRGSHMEA